MNFKNVYSSARYHTLRNLYKVNPSIKQQKKLEHILLSRQIIFLHVGRLTADVISRKVFLKHLSKFFTGGFRRLGRQIFHGT